VPKPFDEPCRGRSYKQLGDAAGLTQFGVNLVMWKNSIEQNGGDLRDLQYRSPPQ
jgi:hypothetical protein